MELMHSTEACRPGVGLLPPLASRFRSHLTILIGPDALLSQYKYQPVVCNVPVTYPTTYIKPRAKKKK